MTQRAIKHALTERWYAWEEARKLARDDPEINFQRRSRPYTPQVMEVDTTSAYSTIHVLTVSRIPCLRKRLRSRLEQQLQRQEPRFCSLNYFKVFASTAQRCVFLDEVPTSHCTVLGPCKIHSNDSKESKTAWR